MIKLLSANFMRLKKDKFFWIGTIFMFIIGILLPIIRYTDMKQTNSINNIDNGFFACSLFIGIIMAVFCSLFIGTEYSDGTLRNKIISGHNRTTIYLSNLITTAIISAGMCGIFFIPYIFIGIPLLGIFKMNIRLVLLFTLTVFTLAIALSSIFVLISMLNTSKAITAIICILLSCVLLLSGLSLNRMLDAPEMIPICTISENGEITETETQNPNYLSGIKRDIIQTIYDIIPGGQAIQCSTIEAVNLPVLPVYSVIIIMFTTGLGLYLFKKKELR